MPPLDPGAKRAILDAVAALEGESVERLAALVRCDSTLGNEAGALDLMAANYESLGLSARRIPTDPEALKDHPGFSPPLISYAGRDNVAAIHTPRETKGRSLALQGGPMSAEEVAAFRALPQAERAVVLRRYDEQAKVRDLETPPVAHFLPFVAACLRAPARA